MTIQSTIDRPRELRLSAMADAFKNQCLTGALQDLRFEDRFGILVDLESRIAQDQPSCLAHPQRRFRYPDACMEDIEYHPDRKQNCGKLLRLSGCGYIRGSRHIVMEHPAAGKHTFPIPWVLLHAGIVLPSSMSSSRT